jgi:uncharacterized protein (DUF58 family)
MNAALGWLLAVGAIAAGYVSYGWPGVVLAVTVLAFWLLLQFSMALRVMRNAAGRPVGSVPNAVMFNARLQAGMRLPKVIGLTGSLGLRDTQAPGTPAPEEAFVWQDAGGDSVRVEFTHGQVSRWQLQRGSTPPAG